jgi:hypothetical protein
LIAISLFGSSSSTRSSAARRSSGLSATPAGLHIVRLLARQQAEQIPRFLAVSFACGFDPKLQNRI